jgi:hypothetical protein
MHERKVWRADALKSQEMGSPETRVTPQFGDRSYSSGGNLLNRVECF